MNLDASQVAYDLSFKVRQTAERSNTKSTHIEVPSNSSPTHQSIMLRPSVHQIQISTSSDYLIIKYYQAITLCQSIEEQELPQVFGTRKSSPIKRRKFTGDTKLGWIVNPGTHPSWPYLPPSSWVSEPEQINLRPLDWLSGWFVDSSCHSLCLSYYFMGCYIAISPQVHKVGSQQILQMKWPSTLRCRLVSYPQSVWRTRPVRLVFQVYPESARFSFRSNETEGDLNCYEGQDAILKMNHKSKYYNKHIVKLTHDTRSQLFSLSQMLALQSRGWGITLDFALGLGLLLKDFPRISEDIKSNVQNQLPQVII